MKEGQREGDGGDRVELTLSNHLTAPRSTYVILSIYLLCEEG